jgi:hypothetical protein
MCEGVRLVWSVLVSFRNERRVGTVLPAKPVLSFLSRLLSKQLSIYIMIDCHNIILSNSSTNKTVNSGFSSTVLYCKSEK